MHLYTAVLLYTKLRLEKGSSKVRLKNLFLLHAYSLEMEPLGPIYSTCFSTSNDLDPFPYIWNQGFSFTGPTFLVQQITASFRKRENPFMERVHGTVMRIAVSTLLGRRREEAMSCHMSFFFLFLPVTKMYGTFLYSRVHTSTQEGTVRCSLLGHLRVSHSMA